MKLFEIRMYSCKDECESYVLKRKFFVPPSALKPKATAIASSNVDLPVPFSPIMNVTFGWKRSDCNVRIAGKQYGYAEKLGIFSFLM